MMKTGLMIAVCGCLASAASAQVLFDNGSAELGTGTISSSGVANPLGEWSECDYDMSTGPDFLNDDVAGYAAAVSSGSASPTTSPSRAARPGTSRRSACTRTRPATTR
ncbi:MAG: hypothetical protein R3B68_06560 [Phycisphaerales bacterium]